MVVIEQQTKEIESLNSDAMGGMPAPMAQPDPMLEQKKNDLSLRIEQVSNKIRRITLHMQAHAEKRDRKNAMNQMTTMQGAAPQMSSPQGGAAQAVQMRSNA